MILLQAPHLHSAHFPKQARVVEDLDGIMVCVMWSLLVVDLSNRRRTRERGDEGRRSLDHESQLSNPPNAPHVPDGK
ncbi:MAG: hypothetical protein Q9199_005754 [Rusavskia elegans]